MKVTGVGTFFGDSPQADVPDLQWEYAWVVEERVPINHSYLCVDEVGLLGWTPDHMKALRFARRVDADAVAGMIEDHDGRAVEHGWYVTPNAEVTGSPALSASPCGLPGYAGGDK